MKAILFSFGLVLALSSCSPSLSTQGPVIVWEQRSDFKLTEWAAQQPGTVLTRAPAGESWSTLMRSSEAGPNLVVAEDSYEIRAALKAGTLADLSVYRDRLPSIQKLWPALLPAEKTPWAVLPSSVYVWGLFYNPGVLKSLGIDPPKTTADLEAALTTLKAQGKTPLALGASFGWPALAWISMLDLRQNGGAAYRDLLAGTRSFEDPGLLKVLETLQAWRDRGWFDGGSSTKNWPESLAEVTGGQAGFVLLGAYAVNRITDADTLAFLSFPQGAAGSSELAVVQGFAVSAASKSAEAALALADAYVRAGSPGQIGDGYRSPALAGPGAGFAQTQNALLQNAQFLLPSLDRAWPPESVQSAGVLMQQFFSPRSTLKAADLARALQTLAR